MDTLFLFTKHLDEEGCFCFKLSAEGVVIASPAQRNFEEIKRLQEECFTLVIETSTNASLLPLELAWLPERKARVAIPYALEDKLAQSLDELHFAFDKTRYENNSYLIAAISKQRIRYIMQLLADHHIEFNTITLDWFALKPGELCVSEATLLINTEHFKGALSGELAENYLKNHPNYPLHLFSDSQIKNDSETIKSQETSYVWIAQQLLKSKIINLCQGDLQHGNKSEWVKKSAQIAGILFCFWLFSLVLVHAINLHFLKKQTQEVDEQITQIYHQFFPGAKQIISPKFRIEQLLKNNNNEEQTRFWFLLNQFATIINTDTFKLEQLHYQNKTLSVTLISNDFASLEQLENQLKKLNMNVKQTQASTHEQHVVATLELT